MSFSSTPVGKASSQRKFSPDCKVGNSLGYSRKTDEANIFCSSAVGFYDTFTVLYV